MRQILGAALLLCCLPALSGCSTVKWLYTDKTTGEAWWIKKTPFSSDQINYCQPEVGAPVQCGPAQMLSTPPSSWASVVKLQTEM